MHNQEILKRIFEIASKELPNNIHTFKGESAIFFKGFKISLEKGGQYLWQDIRYSNYYEGVDKFITSNILTSGFCSTLTKVMYHNDTTKVEELHKYIEELDKQTTYWVKKSSINWHKQKEQQQGILKNKKLSENEIVERLNNLTVKYEKNRVLYEKKRNILKIERINFQADILFYTSRLNK